MEGRAPGADAPSQAQHGGASDSARTAVAPAAAAADPSDAACNGTPKEVCSRPPWLSRHCQRPRAARRSGLLF
eukprot:1794579-Prymnesium_polylepis.1